MDQRLLDLTYRACDAFKSQVQYQRLIELKKIMKSVQEIEDLVSSFQKAKSKYEEAKTYGQYHPDLSRYQKAFQLAKIEMMSNEVIKEYMKIEKDLQKQLDQFSIDLAQSVSTNIKHPKEINMMNLEER